MLWRKFRLDWHYAIGELLIVVAGVLIALAIDQWNDRRLDRNEADEILQHLLIDLRADLNEIQEMVQHVENKEQSLLRLKSIFESGQRPENAQQFLKDIIVGADFGWNQNRPNSTTYREALSSGKFALIRSADLRSAISGYYFNFDLFFDRTDARENQFPHLSYQLVPRNREVGGGDVLLEVESGLSPEDIARLVDYAIQSPIRDYVIGEINLARFILHLSADINRRGEALIDRIETYRASL